MTVSLACTVGGRQYTVGTLIMRHPKKKLFLQGNAILEIGRHNGDT